MRSLSKRARLISSEMNFDFSLGVPIAVLQQHQLGIGSEWPNAADSRELIGTTVVCAYRDEQPAELRLLLENITQHYTESEDEIE